MHTHATPPPKHKKCFDLSFSTDQGRGGDGAGGGLLTVDFCSSLHLWQLPPPSSVLSSPQWKNFVASSDTANGKRGGGEGGGG